MGSGLRSGMLAMRQGATAAAARPTVGVMDTANRSAYVTVPEAAALLGMSVAGVIGLVDDGALTMLDVAGQQLLPRFAVDSQVLAMSSQALLVVTDPVAPERPRRRTRTARIKAFADTTGMTPAAFLRAWGAGDVDATAAHADLVVEAQKLLAGSQEQESLAGSA